MSEKWTSCKARQVLKALNKIGRVEQIGAKGFGSHQQLFHPEYSYSYTWAFHAGEEIGPVMLAKIAKKTGLKREHR